MHKDALTTEIKLRLCDSLILSLVSYCDVVYWPALTVGEKYSLQKLQNSCLKFSYNLRKFDHVTPLFLSSKWLNLEKRYQLHMSTLVYKVLQTKCPGYLFDRLVRGSAVHDRQTRYCQKLTIPRHRTAQYQRSFSYNGAKLFNSLPPAAASCSTVSKFKNMLKSFLNNN